MKVKFNTLFLGIISLFDFLNKADSPRRNYIFTGEFIKGKIASYKNSYTVFDLVDYIFTVFLTVKNFAGVGICTVGNVEGNDITSAVTGFPCFKGEYVTPYNTGAVLGRNFLKRSGIFCYFVAKNRLCCFKIKRYSLNDFMLLRL